MELFDTQFNILIQSLGPGLVPVMKFFSFLGTEVFLLIIISAIYWCINPGLGIRLGIALMTTSCLNSFLKIAFHLPRPYWVDSKVMAYSSEPSFGFPSGHTQKAAATWGILGYAIRRPVAITISIFLILMIGISRLYLGVHFLTDVLAGWIFGVILFLLIVTLEKPFIFWLNQKSNIHIFLILASFGLVLIISGFFIQNNLLTIQIPQNWVHLAERSGSTINPISLNDLFSGIGIWTGLSAGFCWLRSLQKTYGKYHVHGHINQKIWRLILGLAGTLLLFAGVGLILPQRETIFELFLRLFGYGLMGGWISGMAPYVFFKTGLLSPENSFILKSKLSTD